MTNQEIWEAVKMRIAELEAQVNDLNSRLMAAEYELAENNAHIDGLIEMKQQEERERVIGELDSVKIYGKWLSEFLLPDQIEILKRKLNSL
jgi:hypothetical protein